MRLKQVDEAINAYRQAVNIDKTYGLAWCNLGTAFLAKRQHAQARQAYERALELRTGYADALHGLGNTALAEGAYRQALERYGATLRVDSSYFRAHYSLAMAYRSLGDSVRAAQEMRLFRQKQREESDGR